MNNHHCDSQRIVDTDLEVAHNNDIVKSGMCSSE